MKAFTERNPYIIGVFVIVLLAVMTGSALLLNGGFFKSQYTLYSTFKDAAGITPQSKVKIAGVDVGIVSSVKSDTNTAECKKDQACVRIALKINDGVKIPADSKPSVEVDTLLGSRAVTIQAGSAWNDVVKGGSTLPAIGSTPVDLLELQNTSVPLLQQTDTTALNSLIQQLSAVSQGKHADLQQILVGLNRLTTVVDDRQSQAGSLIDSARTLSQTLANRDQDLIGVVQNLDRVVDLLIQRRDQLASLLQSTADATQRLANLIHQNRPALDGIIDQLHGDLIILSNHQMDLAQSVALLSAAIKGFSSVGYSGFPPNEYANSWANIFAQLLGPTDPDALFGACGVVDKALDLTLGPDPASCQNRTGPIFGTTNANSASPATPAQVGTTLPLGTVYQHALATP